MGKIQELAADDSGVIEQLQNLYMQLECIVEDYRKTLDYLG